MRGRLDVAQPLGNLCRFRGITQLVGKLCDSCSIAGPGAADFYSCLFGGGIALFFLCRHGLQCLIYFRLEILTGQNVLSESSKMVTGPSLTNSTDMAA